MYTIGSFENILYLDKIKDRLEALVGIHKTVLKKMFLCDIHQSYETKFENTIPKDCIISKTRYKSTNNSDMVLYQVNTKFIKLK